MSLENAYLSVTTFISKCINTVLSFAKIILQSRVVKRFPEAAGKSCIVMGNGPSLSDSLQKHPSFFEKHTLICVNGFANTSEYSILKPQYYVFLDPFFWESDQEGIKKIVNAIFTKTDWPLTLFVPQKAKKSRLASILRKNPHIHIHYFNYTVFNGFETIGFWLFKHNIASPQCQNVAVAALFLALNMGFKEIILVGADHSWHEYLHVNEQNMLCIKDVHFYDTRPSKEVNYQPLYSTTPGVTWKMNEIFSIWAKVFLGYMVIKNYSIYRHSKIINASELSFIDAFDRMKINP
ncbi:MAG TPA: 6-hydroxymethylpterin diphosphokinase MptE-like protein [Bacteroidia bacterium]|nr:6-hydroxymethylpterin diphosphokinase MptE-like protein [Bacteroidia bacterium]